MDSSETVKKWKAGHEAANAFILEERRNRTVSERMDLLVAFQKRLSDQGLLRKRDDDLEYHLRWNEIRKKFIERQSKV